ncbi:MAG: Wzz/FepE/Etk N-terminal domain-containing protein [Candidatus Rariloculaceae bacterium]
MADTRDNESAGEPLRGRIFLYPDIQSGLISFATWPTKLRQGKAIITLAAVLGLIVGLVLAFVMTPVYRAETVLTVVEEVPSGLNSLMPSVSGLAGLSGFGLGSADQLREEHIAVLRSNSLSRAFIERGELKPVLFSEEWDAESSSWLVPDDEVPTLNDAVEFFEDNVRSIAESTLDGMIHLTVDWKDPIIAEQWANGLVSLADQLIRERAIAESDRSLAYLNAELESTSVVELREAIYSLLETQVQDAMMAKVRDEFAFRVIDPAVAPDIDDPIRPQKILLVGGLIFLFGFAGAILSLLRSRDENEENVSDVT